MRPWARWTAKTALVAVGFAAATGGLCCTVLAGPAFAGTGGGNSGGLTLLGGNGLLAPVSTPLDVCGDVSALLGIAAAGCPAGTAASFQESRTAAGEGAGRGASGNVSIGSGNEVHAPVSAPVDVCGNAVAVLGTATASCAGGASSSTAGTAPDSTVTSGSAPAVFRQTFGDTLIAPGPGPGDADNPAASQWAGLGSLPGLADLPSSTGLTNLSAPRGPAGSSTLMSAGALSAADASGMSSDSFAALAIGALLAGAAALKIASRRARDRKAGIGATI
jgi:hypothetical protein